MKSLLRGLKRVGMMGNEEVEMDVKASKGMVNNEVNKRRIQAFLLCLSDC